MSEEMDDYSGPFKPDLRLEDFSKEALVTLCREFMMVAHLLDRSIMPAILQRFGAQAMEDLAIEEWRGASPVYTQRIRKAMRSKATTSRRSSSRCRSIPASRTSTWT